jgi:hypothetical protein
MKFKIKGHAARVEALFSGMSYTKTKTCNHMNVENLKMFTMISYLARSIPDSERKQRKRKKSGENTMISTLTSSVVNVDDVDESVFYDLEKEFDEM